MPQRFETTPLIIDGEHALRLSRVLLNERQFDEAWLQTLLFDHPDLIPVDELEPIFGPLVPVARELPTASGPVDLLYISPGGYPTLVETKLWRNPEARRQVVAQVIDYATQLSRLSYDDLVDAIGRAQNAGKPLADLMAEAAEDFDEKRFVNTLARNLRGGRMLLLIVGDGIHESVEQMAETLAGAPQLGFTLALVEMAIYRLPQSDKQLLVQPRIVTRTREVVRAVVEVRREVKPEDVIVTLPHLDATGSQQRRPLSEQAFFEQLAANCSSAVSDGFRTLIEEFAEMGLAVVCRESSLSLHFEEPSTGRRFGFGSIYTDGHFEVLYVVYYCRTSGVDEQIARDYLADVATLVPGARVSVTERKSMSPASIRVRDRHLSIDELLSRRTEWRAAIQKMMDRLLAAGEAESAAAV